MDGVIGHWGDGLNLSLFPSPHHPILSGLEVFFSIKNEGLLSSSEIGSSTL
jgi:hypothetical protein